MIGGDGTAGAARGGAPVGGIDLGGTKIEARLYRGPGACPAATRRVATPAGGFEAVLDALADQAAWISREAGAPLAALGVALPGIVDPATGAATAANLPWDGRPLAPALRARLGLAVAVVNDATAFAVSEARGGGGAGARVVLGLVFGTGLGGGLAVDGAPAPRATGLGVEVGHVGLSARAAAAHGLPLLPCPCGRTGCLERYLSGPGLARLGGAESEAALAVWADVAGEALAHLQLLLDPDRIVVGGGLSRLPGVLDRLGEAAARHRLPLVRPPDLRLALHGDASGARGAALLARDAAAPC